MLRRSRSRRRDGYAKETSMSAQTPRHEITMKKLVLDLAGTEGVTVRRDVEYA